MIKKNKFFTEKLQRESGCVKLFDSERQFTGCMCQHICVCENVVHVQK